MQRTGMRKASTAVLRQPARSPHHQPAELVRIFQAGRKAPLAPSAGRVIALASLLNDPTRTVNVPQTAGFMLQVGFKLYAGPPSLLLSGALRLVASEGSAGPWHVQHVPCSRSVEYPGPLPSASFQLGRLGLQQLLCLRDEAMDHLVLPNPQVAAFLGALPGWLHSHPPTTSVPWKLWVQATAEKLGAEVDPVLEWVAHQLHRMVSQGAAGLAGLQLVQLTAQLLMYQQEDGLPRILGAWHDWLVALAHWTPSNPQGPATYCLGCCSNLGRIPTKPKPAVVTRNKPATTPSSPSAPAVKGPSKPAIRIPPAALKPSITTATPRTINAFISLVTGAALSASSAEAQPEPEPEPEPEPKQATKPPAARLSEAMVVVVAKPADQPVTKLEAEPTTPTATTPAAKPGSCMEDESISSPTPPDTPVATTVGDPRDWKLILDDHMFSGTVTKKEGPEVFFTAAVGTDVDMPAVQRANVITAQLGHPAGCVYVTINQSSKLFKYSKNFGYTAQEIALGSHCFQRVLARNDHVLYALLTRIKAGDDAFLPFERSLPPCDELKTRVEEEYNRRTSKVALTTAWCAFLACVHLAHKVTEEVHPVICLHDVLFTVLGRTEAAWQTAKDMACKLEMAMLLALDFVVLQAPIHPAPAAARLPGTKRWSRCTEYWDYALDITEGDASDKDDA